MHQDGKYEQDTQADVPGLWQDVLELPSALAATLDDREGFDAAARLISNRRPGRLVISGNGAAYYVAQALWMASLARPLPGLEVLSVPSGFLAKGRFPWRPDDVFLAVSSSGEFRDLVEAIDRGAPRPYIALTSSPGSSVGRDAMVCASFRVLHQRALTHSQVFCCGVATALSIWATITSDKELRRQVDDLPSVLEPVLADVTRWGQHALVKLTSVPRAAITCSSGAGWAAALEAALLLKEVARVPAEGGETREAATSGMYALAPGDLAFTLSPCSDDPLLEEAEGIFKRAGATVLRAPLPQQPVDERMTGIVMFPASAALAIHLAKVGGFDPDQPDWATTYYETAR